MTNAFVAGATGLTGRSVVQQLAGRGLAVVAHVRPDSTRRAQWQERFEAMGAAVDHTAWDEAQMTARLREGAFDLVFALLGTTKRRARREAAGGEAPSYESVDYGLTALLRRAAEASGAAPRFIYLSAMGVTPTTGNAYLRARARIESELAAGALPYVSARPSLIVGERDEPRLGERIGAALLDPALALVGALGGATLRDRYRSMTGPELAAALVAAALDPSVEGIVEADRLRGLAASLG